MRAHGMINSNQILHGDIRLYLKKLFFRVDHAWQNVCDGMLTHDLFAVANLLCFCILDGLCCIGM